VILRILFLSTWFPFPPDNGSKLRVYHLLAALAKRHEVTLASFAFDTAQPKQADELRTWCRNIRTVPVNPFEVNRASTLSTFLSPDPVTCRPVPSMSRLVDDVFGAQHFDVVIASTEMMAVYAQQAPPATARVLEEHNAMSRWAYERYMQTGNPVQRARRWVSWRKSRRHEARLFPRFDLITMVSEADRRAALHVVDGHRVRVEVVPNGVDCIHNQPSLTAPRPGALVYNGSLTYSANYDAVQWFLAEIYPRIKEHRPDVSLAVTGSTKGVDTAALALDDSVTLTGYVEDVRIPVAEAAACVIPIRQGGGTRLKILEAMALGTPVVATRKGAEGLEVVDGEHLLLADDAEHFASRTVELLSDANLRSRLAANARRLVEERYDWAAIGACFVSLVEETVGRRG